MLLEKFKSVCTSSKELTPFSDEILSKYSEKVPNEIHELWQYGCGSYMNDFFWVIDPEDFEGIKNEIYLPFQL